MEYIEATATKVYVLYSVICILSIIMQIIFETLTHLVQQYTDTAHVMVSNIMYIIILNMQKLCSTQKQEVNVVRLKWLD